MTEQQGQRQVNLVYLSLLAVLVGIGTGYGAVAFRSMIALIHNIGFRGLFSFAYDANQFTPQSPLGLWIILVPVGGALIVTFLVKNFAPEAKGHGVPEVMDAVYYKAGAIRPVVVVVKSFASAISIGTGGAVGREGPIVQIGSAFASSIGGWLGLAPWQRITLVAAGAGGGIAATFNTPLGAVLFAVELMLPEISVRTFMPVALATATATFVGRLYFGYRPTFSGWETSRWSRCSPSPSLASSWAVPRHSTYAPFIGPRTSSRSTSRTTIYGMSSECPWSV